PRGALVPRFRGFDYYRHIVEPRPEERRIARVSKDGHKRDRASGHPSRRRTALDVPISGKPEIGAPHQDEVCGFKLHPPDPIGFMESIYLFLALLPAASIAANS